MNQSDLPHHSDVRDRIWVTRKGVKVDRIACAWFIRRFVDPNANLAFVDPAKYVSEPSHLRFDMAEGEFTHENDMCTFEVLVKWKGMADRTVAAIAEVIHDIDLKRDKYQRPETSGIREQIEGIVRRHADDLDRIREGEMLFDSFYANFGQNGDEYRTRVWI